MKKIITTTKGAVEGVEKNGYVVFKGIPYAKAPIGELREMTGEHFIHLGYGIHSVHWADVGDR